LNSLGRPKEDFKSFSESLAIFERISDNAGQAVSQLEIGKLLRGAVHFKVALDFFQRALNTHQWVGNPVKVAIDFEAWISYLRRRDIIRRRSSSIRRLCI
jgi:hypothetical protein